MKKKNASGRSAGKKGVDYGKKRFRIADPVALVISGIVVALAATLAALSNQTGFDRAWYGDVLTTAVCVIGFFALLNIGYVLIDGITVENGIVFLGVDENRQAIAFSVGELAEIGLRDADGNELPPERHFWGNAVICFALTDGTVREYRAHLLTGKTYRSILNYFGNRS